MTKFLIYQLGDNPAERDAFFYKNDGTIFSAERARELFSNGAYQKVATVKAMSLEHVYELTNLWPGNEAEWIERHAPMHSLSVGDLVVNETTGGAFIMASFGFDFLVDARWSTTFDVITWMAEHGHPEYRDQIRAIEESEAVGNITTIDAEGRIEAICDDAMSRYQDWATD